MKPTAEQWQQCREEVNRLKRELKALNSRRASLSNPEEIETARVQAHDLQVRYDTALQKLKEMKEEFEWERCIEREFIAAEAEASDKEEP